MPASLRAVLLSALHAAALASLPLIGTQGGGLYLVAATFLVAFFGSLLLSYFHWQLTPVQAQELNTGLAALLAQIGPALVALLDRQPAPAPAAPVVAVTPAPATTVTVTETAAAPAPVATP